jgi:hypothetical protein
VYCWRIIRSSVGVEVRLEPVPVVKKKTILCSACCAAVCKVDCVLIGPIGYGDEEFMAEYGYIEIKPVKLRPIALGGKAALLRAVRILVIFDIIDIFG